MGVVSEIQCICTKNLLLKNRARPRSCTELVACPCLAVMMSFLTLIITSALCVPLVIKGGSESYEHEAFEVDSISAESMFVPLPKECVSAEDFAAIANTVSNKYYVNGTDYHTLTRFLKTMPPSLGGVLGGQVLGLLVEVMAQKPEWVAIPRTLAVAGEGAHGKKLADNLKTYLQGRVEATGNAMTMGYRILSACPPNDPACLTAWSCGFQPASSGCGCWTNVETAKEAALFSGFTTNLPVGGLSALLASKLGPGCDEKGSADALAATAAAALAAIPAALQDSMIMFQLTNGTCLQRMPSLAPVVQLLAGGAPGGSSPTPSPTPSPSSPTSSPTSSPSASSPTSSPSASSPAPSRLLSIVNNANEQRSAGISGEMSEEEFIAASARVGRWVESIYQLHTNSAKHTDVVSRMDAFEEEWDADASRAYDTAKFVANPLGHLSSRAVSTLADALRSHLDAVRREAENAGHELASGQRRRRLASCDDATTPCGCAKMEGCGWTVTENFDDCGCENNDCKSTQAKDVKSGRAPDGGGDGCFADHYAQCKCNIGCRQEWDDLRDDTIANAKVCRQVNCPKVEQKCQLVAEGAIFSKSGSSCAECGSQSGCALTELWTRLGKSLTGLQPHVKVFHSADAVQEHTMANEYQTLTEEIGGKKIAQALCGAVVVKAETNKDVLDYTIRLNMTNLGGMDNAQHTTIRPRRGSFKAYKDKGLLTLQRAVETFLVQETSGSTDVMDSLTMFPGAIGDYRLVAVLDGDSSLNNISSFSQNANIMMVLLAFFAFGLVGTEKETKIREGMRSMGLSDAGYYIGVFLFSAVWFLIPCFVFTLVVFNFPASGLGEGESLFMYSDASLIFLAMWLGSLASLALGLALSSFFAKAQIGKYFGLIILILSDQVNSALTSGAGPGAITAGCLLPAVALRNFINVWYDLEMARAGVQWSTLTVDSGNVSLSTVLGMLVLDIVLFMGIFYYIDQVRGSAGLMRPWNFPLTISFWKELFVAPSPPDAAAIERSMQGAGEEGEFIEKADEKHLQMQRANECLKVRGLVKMFKTFKAVDGVDLTMYKNEIFALLGHNGAGKTTTINCLTGMLSADSGAATVFGSPLEQTLRTSRREVGVCPQHNVLWEELTVYEHLTIFGKLKQMGRKEAAEQAEHTLKELGLSPKRNSMSKTLSGGMKRKLSLAIAMMGSPNLVFLDEPSSGMDPTARRECWDILEMLKEGRVVVLTTHYMDEADVLGDRVAIMAMGQVRCCGSGAFLKRKYACGYNLNFQLSSGTTSSSILKRVADGVTDKFNPRIVSEVGQELIIVVEFGASAGFESLFNSIDNDRASWGVDSWSVSVCNLEEVFLRVASGDEGSAAEKRLAGEQVDAVEAASPGAGGAPSRPTFSQQFGALFRKRMRYSSRDVQSLFCQLLCPVMLMTAYLLFIQTQFSDKPSVVYDWSKYNTKVLDPSPKRVLPIAFHDAALRSSMEPSTAKLVELGFIDGVKWMDLSGASNLNCTCTIGAANQAQLLLCFPKEDVVGESSCVKEALKNNNATVDTSTCQDWLTFSQQTRLLSDAEMNDQQIPSRRLQGGGGAAAEAQSGTGASLDFPASTRQCTVAGRTVFSRTGDLTCATLGKQNPSTGVLSFGNDPTHAASFYFATHAMMWDTTAKKFQTAVSINLTGVHAIPHALNTHSNMVLQSLMPGAPLIQAGQNPFSLTPRERSEQYNSLFIAIIIGIGLLQALSFPSPFSVGFIVKETAWGVKSQQLVSGVSVGVYWFANYVYDLLLWILPIATMVLLIAAFQIEILLDGPGFGLALLTLILFVLAVVPYSYCLSHFFRKPENAQNVLLIFNLVVVFLLFFMWFIFEVLDNPGMRLAMRVIVWILRLFPAFCMAESIIAGMFALAFVKLMPLDSRSADYQTNCLADLNEGKLMRWQCAESAYDMNAAGGALLMMGLEAVIYMVIILWWDMKCQDPAYRRRTDFKAPAVEGPAGWKDQDVLAEEALRATDDPLQSNIHLKGVRKVYGVPLVAAKASLCPKKGAMHAVKGVSMGCAKGDVFGLLGVNGAGKTTTFKMLSGIVTPTDGEVHVAGHSLQTANGVLRAREQIGYCPQEDALIDLLTVTEHLYIYGAIKGIPAEQLPAAVQMKIQGMDLDMHINKQAGSLSGGNKRKLMVALAMMREPSMILLDEPSAGMDPMARRFMWDVIQAISSKRRQCTVVLTTHSMEECESLCTKTTIMVNGVYRCFGTHQHIKEVYGQGFELSAKFHHSTPQENSASLAEFGLPSSGSVSLKDALERISGKDAFIHKAVEGATGPFDKFYPPHGETDPTKIATRRSAHHEKSTVTVTVLGEWLTVAKKVKRIVAWAAATFGVDSIKLLEWHSTLVKLLLPKANSSVARLFGQVESAKETLRIAEYSLSQTTLEQIFHNFAAEQEGADAAGGAAAAGAAGSAHQLRQLEKLAADDAGAVMMAGASVGGPVQLAGAPIDLPGGVPGDRNVVVQVAAAASSS